MEASNNLSSLFWAAVIAVFGFIAKSIYEIYLEDKKRDREKIELKLQNFYWPINIRLNINRNVYKYLFQGKSNSDKNSNEYKIAKYVEENILLKNHEEILQIITNYRYLANADNEIDEIVNVYIKHVSIYKALIDSGIDGFPGIVASTPYPRKIDDYFSSKTDELQKDLDKRTI
jgi:hypothetical protein